MDRELLLEIGCEEIPASWLPGLTDQVGEKLVGALTAARLAPSAPAETFSTPRRLTSPYVGFMPTTPHMVAGFLTEPPVSVPMAAGKKPAAVAAPEPLDEPPQKCSWFHGLRAGGHGKSNDGPPVANSWVDNLPMNTPPALRSFCVTTASLRATLSRRIFECAVVGSPA